MSAPNLFHAEHGYQMHNGRGCPVSPETRVRAQYRCGHITKRTYEAHKLRWSHKGEVGDIMAYLVKGEGK